MSRVAYILSKPDGEFYNINCFVAYEGFTELGYEVRKFRAEELSALPLTAETVLHGTILLVRKALERLRCPVPGALPVPKTQERFLLRRQWRTTLGEIRTLADAPVFIKPLRDSKTFTGHVVHSHRELILTAAFTNDYPVLAQDAITFVSEWRVFVLQGEVLGIGNYKGDPLLYPDRETVRACLAAWCDAPVAYGADFGITEEGRTALVEVNDAHSLGSYGLPTVRYARMIEARWDEMTGRG